MRVRNPLAVGLMLAVSSVFIVASEPRSQQARLARNEALAIADLRDILAAAQAYRASNRAWPSALECLSRPSSCGFYAGTPAFLDYLRGADTSTGLPGVLTPSSFMSHGYLFTYVAGISGGGLYEPGVQTFTIDAVPIIVGVSGTRSYGADSAGIICVDATDTFPNDGFALPVGCAQL